MIKIAQGITGLGGFVVLAIGLAMLGVTIWAFTNAALSFNEYSLLGVLLAFDFVIILSAVLGICGTKRQNGLMICIFLIFVIVFFFAFSGIGIAAELIPSTLFNGNCTSSNNGLIQVAHQSYTTSSFFCLFVAPCGLSDDAIANGNYTIIQQTAMKSLYSRNANGALKFQDTDIGKQAASNQTVQSVFTVLGSIESAFRCSGWCEGDNRLIYSFSNVNNGKPLYPCYNIMREKAGEFGNTIGIAAFISAAFFMLICVCGLLVCFSPERKSLAMNQRLTRNYGNTGGNYGGNGNYRPL